MVEYCLRLLNTFSLLYTFLLCQLATKKKGTPRSHERATELLLTDENRFDLDIFGRSLVGG